MSQLMINHHNAMVDSVHRSPVRRVIVWWAAILAPLAIAKKNKPVSRAHPEECDCPTCDADVIRAVHGD